MHNINRKTFDDINWQDTVTDTCLTIAACEHADAKDRLYSLRVISAINGDKPLPVAEGFPIVLRDTLMAIIKGPSAPVNQEVREAMHERLAGVDALLMTYNQLGMEEGLLQLLEPGHAPALKGTEN